MSYLTHEFDLVISNSLVHHLPNPLPFFQEIKRVLKPSGKVLIRDLLRPQTLSQLEQIIQQANLDYNPHQEKLFRDSLHAAFTIDEITQFVTQAGFVNFKIYQSSPRHWTLLLA